jgi:hypothetical protein
VQDSQKETEELRDEIVLLCYLKKGNISVLLCSVLSDTHASLISSLAQLLLPLWLTSSNSPVPSEPLILMFELKLSMLIDVEFWIQARSSSELPAGLRYAQMIVDISRTKLSFFSLGRMR